MDDYPQSIMSQLADCLMYPGIWSGCPPDRHADTDLTFMITHRLVSWSPAHKGYLITSRGEAALARSAQWKAAKSARRR